MLLMLGVRRGEARFLVSVHELKRRLLFLFCS